MTTKNTKRHRTNPEQEARIKAFSEMAKQLKAELKTEQETGAQEGKHTAKLAKIAISPALAGLQRYSPYNQLLILKQCPHATETAGLVTWNERGYRVKKGEHCIYISAPHELMRGQAEEEGDDEGASVGFHRARVFDISQVEPIESAQATASEQKAATAGIE